MITKLNQTIRLPLKLSLKHVTFLALVNDLWLGWLLRRWLRRGRPAGRRKNMISRVANLQVASFPDTFHHFTTMLLLLSTVIILPIVSSNNLWFKEVLFMKNSSWWQGILGFLECETPPGWTGTCRRSPHCRMLSGSTLWLKGQRVIERAKICFCLNRFYHHQLLMTSQTMLLRHAPLMMILSVV